jgi:hypothetical protein
MRLAALALLPPLSAAIGCAGSVAGPEGGDAETATTSALVTVERTTDTTEGVGSRARASARFLRVTAPASAVDALRAIGATLNLPARGTCATIASLGDSPMAQAPVVELVDVGEVSLSAEGVETHLVARQLPDVTDVVSGVIYARATDTALLPASARYTVHIAGSPGLSPLQIVATAPSDPGDIQIAGEDVAGTLVSTAATVDLSWPADRAGDVIYIDVRPAGVRCVLDGIPRLATVRSASLAAALLDDAGSLVVHRLRREPLRTDGIDSGEIRFDFARTVAYTRR